MCYMYSFVATSWRRYRDYVAHKSRLVASPRLAILDSNAIESSGNDAYWIQDKSVFRVIMLYI